MGVVRPRWHRDHPVLVQLYRYENLTMQHYSGCFLIRTRLGKVSNPAETKKYGWDGY
jgi:hypothetical protein